MALLMFFLAIDKSVMNMIVSWTKYINVWLLSMEQDKNNLT